MSYPEAQRILDYESLHLKPFLSGALIRYGGRFHELSDPWRRPFAAVRSLWSPIGSLADKLRVASLRRQSLRGTIEDRFRDPETTSLQSLQRSGFSTSMIDRFFKPFLGGVFLDAELQSSSRMLQFVFRMFSTGLNEMERSSMTANQASQNWPELAIDLYDKLTGRDAEISYSFDNLEVFIPSSTSPDAQYAKWKFNGALRISTRNKTAGEVKP